MLYFLIKFLLAYYFSYGLVYRHYLIINISKTLKKKKKKHIDETEITKAVGREVDTSLKDEIDEQIDILEEEKDSNDDNPKIEKSFSFTHVTFEDILNRIDKYLHVNIGSVSMKLYQNYYSESISSLLNRSIIIIFLITNLILSRISVYCYFGSGIIMMLLDDGAKKSLYEIIGKRIFKLFKYNEEYILYENIEKPKDMDKNEYLDPKQIDMF